MILPFGLFSPEERCPLRSILAGVFLYLLPFNKGIKRERWLTRRSTFRKKSVRGGWPGGQPSCNLVIFKCRQGNMSKKK